MHIASHTHAPRRLLVILSACAVAVSAATVKVEKGDAGWQLLVDGEPMRVRGAGGSQRLGVLVASGGNSIRTWDAGPEAGALLDRAHELGLKVTLGIWLGHERHGFDYTDNGAVVAQLERAREAIVTYRDHPGLLAWAVGNEMEGDGANPAIWYAVDHVARLCKILDPDHPTMTVIAEVGEPKVASVHRFCPHIDMVGINTYGGVGSIVERYREAGGMKPCIITEYGPPGPWEMDKTDWGTPYEMSSTAKAEWYAKAYRDTVLAHPDICLGSYAFIWGHKQEATATWFGLFLDSGERLGAVDALAKLWGGPAPANRCPRIDTLEADAAGLAAGDTFEARVEASDPDGDPLKIRWLLRTESGQHGTGGDTQAATNEFPDAVEAREGGRAAIRFPAGGAFRLFVYVYDGAGGAATANIPIHAEGEPWVPTVPRAELPYVLYDDALNETVFVPSGYMGNAAALRMNPACTDNPKTGTACLEARYDAVDQWGGVVWQSPPDDWGHRPGGLDLTGATALRFAIRGAEGDETLKLGVGLLKGDLPFPDSTQVELTNVTLTSEWKTLRIPLDGRDLSRVKTAFYWTAAGQGKPVRFFIDDMQFVREP